MENPRTCIFCRKIFKKEELIRLTVNDSGEVVIDESKKMGGRGAWVCNEECLDGVIKTRQLDCAFRRKVSTNQLKVQN